MNPKKEPSIFVEASLERNFLWSLAITILPVISSFVVSWVVARWAGPEVIGKVSWVMAFATACLIVGKFGIGVAASRLASEYGVHNPKYLRPLLRAGLELRVLFTLSVSLVTLLFSHHLARFFGDTSLARPIQIGALVIVCASVYEFSEHFLVGLNRFASVYKIRGVYHLARILFTVAIVASGLGAIGILSGYCLAWGLAIFLYFLFFARLLPSGGDGSSTGEIRKRLFRLSLPLAISGASVAVYSQMDKIMLGYFCNMEEVGQYTVARNVVEVSLFPVFGLIMTLRPALASRFAAGSIEECASIIKKTLFVSLISGVLFASIFATMGKPLIVFVFSEHFSYAGTLMIVFAWVIGMRSIGAVILPSLVASERMKAYAYITFGSAVGNFLFNLILIPRFLAMGAVIATIISYALLLFLGLRMVIRVFKIRISGRHLCLSARVLVAGFATVLVIGKLFPSPGPQASVLLWTVQGVVLYAIFLFLLRVVGLRDLRYLKKLGGGDG